MTAIAWDGETLAADKQTSWGDLKFATTKIRKLADGTLIATAGTVSLCESMIGWIMRTRAGEAVPWPSSGDDHGYVVMVSPAGEVEWYAQDRPFPMKVEQKFMAWGSAREIAMGAMYAGATAARAVEICTEISPGCGFGVQVERPGIENPG